MSNEQKRTSKGGFWSFFGYNDDDEGSKAETQNSTSDFVSSPDTHPADLAKNSVKFAEVDDLKLSNKMANSANQRLSRRNLRAMGFGDLLETLIFSTRPVDYSKSLASSEWSSQNSFNSYQASMSGLSLKEYNSKLSKIWNEVMIIYETSDDIQKEYLDQLESVAYDIEKELEDLFEEFPNKDIEKTIAKEIIKKAEIESKLQKIPEDI